MSGLLVGLDDARLISSFASVLQDLSVGEFTLTEWQAVDTLKRRFFVVVGIVGTCKGRMVLDSDHDAVLRITQSMNFDEPVLDLAEQCLYMAELTNMLGGKLITLLNNAKPGTELRLTPPAIFSGLDLMVTSPQMKGRRLRFAMGDTVFNLEISVEGM